MLFSINLGFRGADTLFTELLNVPAESALASSVIHFIVLMLFQVFGLIVGLAGITFGILAPLSFYFPNICTTPSWMNKLAEIDHDNSEKYRRFFVCYGEKLIESTKKDDV